MNGVLLVQQRNLVVALPNMVTLAPIWRLIGLDRKLTMWLVVALELHPIAVMLIGDEVDCSRFMVKLPPESISVLRQLKPAGNMQVLCMKVAGLKRPSAKSAESTIDMMSIAQP